MSVAQGFQSFHLFSLRIGRLSWLASTWFAPADTVQKLVEQQNENGWLKIGHKVLGACTRALPAPYPCSQLSLKARRPRPQLQFKHLILRVCQSAGGRAFNYSFIKVHFEFVNATLLRCQMSQCLNVSM